MMANAAAFRPPKASAHGADKQQLSRKNSRSTPRMNQKSPQKRGGRLSSTSVQPRFGSPFLIKFVSVMYERVNRYTVNFSNMLTLPVTYGKMFLDRKGCGRRWIEALKERGDGWRLRVGVIGSRSKE